MLNLQRGKADIEPLLQRRCHFVQEVVIAVPLRHDVTR